MKAAKCIGSNENSPSELFTSRSLVTRMSRAEGGRISGSQPRSNSRSLRASSSVAYRSVTFSQLLSARIAAAARSGAERIDLTMIGRIFVKRHEDFFD